MVELALQPRDPRLLRLLLVVGCGPLALQLAIVPLHVVGPLNSRVVGWLPRLDRAELFFDRQRVEVHVGLSAQLGRQLQVAVPLGGVAPVGQAAAVDAFVTASLFERPIRRLLPRLAGLL